MLVIIREMPTIQARSPLCRYYTLWSNQPRIITKFANNVGISLSYSLILRIELIHTMRTDRTKIYDQRTEKLQSFSVPTTKPSTAPLKELEIRQAMKSDTGGICEIYNQGT